ncbi:MAG: septal ring lytic transglycosylase RlpA family protein [Alphaproteobacteria bacterium]|nr:septal ring lytic transglycosylase RlpA family protein [Alphaproteobacteria bacterium]
MKHLSTIATVLLLLTACAEQPAPPGVKIGKPYVIEGKTYYPAYDPDYDKTGIASWYGPGFHGKSTANGERYDKYDLTAAHPTLPMPSLVRVTNLENGKSLVVRVNDRGPFAENRIIDLSKRSAQLLGITGLAKVRVQFLKAETERYLAERQQRGGEIDMFAYNEEIKSRKETSIAQSTEPEEAAIVETSIATSGTDQIASAAPVMSVGSGDLKPKPSSPQRGKEVVLHKPERRLSLISEAKAETIAAETPEATTDKQSDSVEPGALVLNNPKPLPIKLTESKQSNKDRHIAPSAGVPAAGYFIQAGSFSTEMNAQKLKDKLSHISDVRVENIEVTGKRWWRVRVGPFEEKSTADMTLTEVRSSGAPEARIVQQ